MNALLTGANGFIGSHISQELKKRGYTVIPLIHENLTNVTFLTRFTEEISPKIIIHCAGYGNHSTQTSETEMVLSNILMLQNLIEATKQLKYSAFINVSTSSVYGRTRLPMKEHLPLNGESMYAATKIAGEKIAKHYAQTYKLPIVTVRPFSVYGEGEADFRFIPTIVKSIVTGERFPLDPLSNHDWIYVKDFVRGVMYAVEYAVKLRGQELNIGTGEQHTNKEVVDMLSAAAGKKANYSFSPRMRAYDGSNWTAHIKKLESLGFRQHYDIYEGLARTYEYYAARYKTT